MNSSDHSICPLGDCTEIQGGAVTLPDATMHAARALTGTLTRAATAVRYAAMPVIVKTPSMLVMASPPACN